MTIGRELKALGFAKLRPARAIMPERVRGGSFHKDFPAELAATEAKLAKGTEIELWWADEARIGQKNKITNAGCGAARHPALGTPGPDDYVGLHLEAIRPKKGKVTGLVLPYCDTGAMNQHLAEISAAVDLDPCHHHSGPRRLAHHAEARGTAEHLAALPAALLARTEPLKHIWQFMPTCLDKQVVSASFVEAIVDVM